MHLQVILSEGMVGVQGDLLELLQGADMDGNQTLDYREFLAATMEKVQQHYHTCCRCRYDQSIREYSTKIGTMI